MRQVLDIDPRLGYIDQEESSIFPSIVTLSGEIDEEVSTNFRRQLEAAEAIAGCSKQGVIPICIDSYGGDVYAMMSIIDAIDACRIPVATIVEGKAMSAAATIFSCGTPGFRFMGPSATLMIHRAQTGSKGNTETLESDYREIKRMDDLDLMRLAKNAGKQKKFFLSMIRKVGNSDVFLDAKRCKELGITDHIRIPTFRTVIKLYHEFS